ncbi:GGDEF domain-containing protein [candidate division KSB1 bacterium]
MTSEQDSTVEDIVKEAFASFTSAVDKEKDDRKYARDDGIIESEIKPKIDQEEEIDYPHYLKDVTLYNSQVGEIRNIAKSYFECLFEGDELATEISFAAKTEYVLRILNDYVDLSLVAPMTPEDMDSEEGKGKAENLHNLLKKMKSEDIVSVLGKIKNNEIKELKKASMRDGLTKLYNREHFDERIEDEVDRIKRRKNGLSVSLIMVDIDDFAEFNDRYSHQIGDLVLKYVGEALTKRRKSDIVARYGGEEFAVIIPDSTKETAEEAAEEYIGWIRSYVTNKLREDANNLPELEDFTGEVTVSAGIATLNHQKDQVYDLINNADDALYLVKFKGKNEVHHFDPDMKEEYKEARKKYNLQKKGGLKNEQIQT